MPVVDNRVRNVRIALGLTQEAFARQVGVGLKAVQHWESGRRSGPDSKSLAKIAAGLGDRGQEAAVYIAGISGPPPWVESLLEGVRDPDAVAEALEVPTAQRTRKGGRP